MTAPKRRYTMTTRAAKAQGTRDRIRESAIAIYFERPIEDFTLEDVARRAGTTVQTILRAYGSKEELVLAALGALAASGTPAKPTKPGDIPAAVRVIFDIYETIGDVQIARLAEERRHPALKPLLDAGRAGHGDWVATVFAKEIENRPDLYEMLNVVTDVYVWKLLRRDRGLDRTRAEAIVTSMISALLKECSDGKHAVAELVGRREPAT
jgi:AcrR family transcriptional regulator